MGDVIISAAPSIAPLLVALLIPWLSARSVSRRNRQDQHLQVRHTALHAALYAVAERNLAVSVEQKTAAQVRCFTASNELSARLAPNEKVISAMLTTMLAMAQSPKRDHSDRLGQMTNVLLDWERGAIKPENVKKEIESRAELFFTPDLTGFGLIAPRPTTAAKAS